MAYLSPVIAVGVTLLLILAMFAVAGLAPLASLQAFVLSPVDSLYGVGELLLKASPLVLIAIGLAVGFRAGVWNIGAEGQLVVGVIFGGALALRFASSDSPLLLPAMIVAGGLGGALWAAIPALLRTRFNASEILVSLMLNYIAQLWLTYLVFGPWRDPAGFNSPQSAPLSPAALLPVIVDGTRINAGILLVPLAVAVGWLFLERSYAGFQLRVIGLADGAARYAGFSTARAVWISMLAGGTAAGIAGVCELAGPLGQIFPTVSPGYGYAAIIVAFLGRLNAVGILFAGLLMGLLYLSGDAAQLEFGLPASVTALFQGALLFLLFTVDVFIVYRVRFLFPVRGEHGLSK
jgi:simple sugar transport system permease protein